MTRLQEQHQHPPEANRTLVLPYLSKTISSPSPESAQLSATPDHVFSPRTKNLKTQFSISNDKRFSFVDLTTFLPVPKDDSSGRLVLRSTDDHEPTATITGTHKPVAQNIITTPVKSKAKAKPKLPPQSRRSTRVGTKKRKLNNEELDEIEQLERMARGGP